MANMAKFEEDNNIVEYEVDDQNEFPSEGEVTESSDESDEEDRS